MTLVEFMRARLDEDEQIARAANTDEARRPWGDQTLQPVPSEGWGDLIRGYLGGEIGEHAARWDPARVLAEVAAKRAMLAAHGPNYDDATCCQSCGCLDCGSVPFPCPTLLAVVQVWAEHPDFDPAWGAVTTDEQRETVWACSHPTPDDCRCDQMMTCICDACCARRWPG